MLRLDYWPLRVVKDKRTQPLVLSTAIVRTFVKAGVHDTIGMPFESGHDLERRRDLDRPRHYLRRCRHHHLGLRHARRTIGWRANIAATATIKPASAGPTAVAAGKHGNRDSRTRK